jgi:CMP-N,N'-diacetyllegionaminic acid synthase
MKILALIPARGGSKGVPKKNSKLLNGLPLIAYTIKAALDAKQITAIAVSSDMDEILDIAKEYAIETIKRPAELALDTSASIDVVLHALDYFEKENNYFDAVLLLQPTAPFREKGFIDKAIAHFKLTDADTLLSVLEVPHEYNPHWTFEQKNDQLVIATGEEEIIKRRQDLPKAFFRDGSIYITKTQLLQSKKSFYGSSIVSIESNPDYYCNIDTPKDWEIATVKSNHLEL